MFLLPKSSFGENGRSRSAMMHVVIFLAKRYKSRYRTSTGESNRSTCDFSPMLFPTWDELHKDTPNEDFERPIMHFRLHSRRPTTTLQLVVFLNQLWHN